MTITDEGASSSGVLAPGGQADTPSTSTRRRRYKSVVALLLAAAVVGAGWWWSHPAVYGGVGNEFGAHPDRLVPVYVVMVEEPEAGHLRVMDAEPRVRVFGEAQAEVLLCDDAQIGIVSGDDVERPCFGPDLD